MNTLVNAHFLYFFYNNNVIINSIEKNGTVVAYSCVSCRKIKCKVRRDCWSYYCTSDSNVKSTLRVKFFLNIYKKVLQFPVIFFSSFIFSLVFRDKKMSYNGKNLNELKKIL